MTPAQKSLVARLENKVLPLWTGAAQEAADMIKGLCADLEEAEKKHAATLKTVTR